MILASIALGPEVTTPPELRAGTRRQAFDPELLFGLATLARFYLAGRTLTASIDDDGVWTCAREPRLGRFLDSFFGPSFEPTTYYSPDHRSVEVARDAAYALGGRVLGATIAETDADESVVY